MVTVRFALIGVCYISEEHARLSGPPHHRDTLGKERFLVSCACVRWACCDRNAVVSKPPGLACQEGGMHPSPVWVSALFDGGGPFLVMDAGWWLLFLCSAFGYSWSACSLPGIPQCAGIHWRTTLHLLQSYCICVARSGDLFVWRASNTYKASVRTTVGEHGSKESLTKVASCLRASVSAL